MHLEDGFSDHDSVSEQQVCVCVLTYGDDDRGDESPADLEEERRREAQHHLNIFKVVPVACKKQKSFRNRGVQRQRGTDSNIWITAQLIPPLRTFSLNDGTYLVSSHLKKPYYPGLIGQTPACDASLFPLLCFPRSKGASLIVPHSVRDNETDTISADWLSADSVAEESLMY